MNKVIEEMKVTMIGSTREGPRTFYHNEVDIHLALSEEFGYFDAEKQVLERNRRTGWLR